MKLIHFLQQCNFQFKLYRFFPADGNKYDKNGNALAGTVVDQGINHPTEGDYYLLSHEGIQVRNGV